MSHLTNPHSLPAIATRSGEAGGPNPKSNMVGVAQLVEPQVVALVVVGSSPITHPIKNQIRAVSTARIRLVIKKMQIGQNSVIYLLISDF